MLPSAAPHAPRRQCSTDAPRFSSPPELSPRLFPALRFHGRLLPAAPPERRPSSPAPPLFSMRLSTHIDCPSPLCQATHVPARLLRPIASLHLPVQHDLSLFSRELFGRFRRSPPAKNFSASPSLRSPAPQGFSHPLRHGRHVQRHQTFRKRFRLYSTAFSCDG